MSPSAQIFSARSVRRWALVRWAATAIACFSLFVLATLAWAAFSAPLLPHLPLSWRAPMLRAVAPPRARREPPIRVESAKFPADSVARYGFFVNWDDNSFVSLKHNARSLDVLAPEWMHLASAAGDVRPDDSAREGKVRAWLREHAPDVRIVPLVNNFNSATQRWNTEAALAMLSSPAARTRFIAACIHNLRPSDQGLHLDFEAIPRSAMNAYVTLVRALAARLHAQGRVLDVSVPATDDAYPFGELLEASDHVVLMVYDEHAMDNDPGPVASQGWFEDVLDQRFRDAPAGKLVVAIGAYGYDWRNGAHGRIVSVQEAWQAARESEAAIHFDPAALNPAFAYVEDDGAKHQVWFLDAAAGFNQAAAALSMYPGGLALWRLGSEDPGVWAWFARGRMPNAGALAAMRAMHAGYDIVYDGDGEALRLTAEPRAGLRAFAYQPSDNLITGETVLREPEAVTLTRWGATSRKLVALTFDDGPDPRWTPPILDILRRMHAPATFFVVGDSVLAHTEILRRMLREGHDVGSHTFTHPNIGEISDAGAEFELNETERVIEALANVRPLLFRPPYAEDIEPETIDDARVVGIASRLGYTTLGLRVDPGDWTRPGADRIVEETMAQVEAGRGHVVLLHDSGGDRSQTVAALPRIIARLRADGWRFVTAHELLGLSRAALMPRPPPTAALFVERAAFFAAHNAESVAAWLFLAGLFLGIVRFVIIAGLALAQWRMAARRRPLRGARPSLAVIVPAFNEERVVVETVRSILNSERDLIAPDGFDVLIVDDGSQDATAAVARAAFAGRRDVRVIAKANGGKASAINLGLAATEAEVIVVIDADTVLDRAALGLLARHFENARVGAVAGDAKVGNRVNTLTRFQALEYVTSQNLDRRAFETLNAMTVIPGAIGAWRRDALLAIGGFSSQTLAEDADATIHLQRAGWRVLYEPDAVAWTEAPETIGAFMKQRFRWMYGTLQAAFKHRDAAVRPGSRRIGWTILPNVFVFQVLFPLISPLMDGLMLWSVAAAAYVTLMHPGAPTPEGLGHALLFYLLFLLVELLGAVIGFCLDRREDWRLLLLIVAQRFCYRQLLYRTAIRAIVAALRGGPVGWGKLSRTAQVRARSLQARA